MVPEILLNAYRHTCVAKNMALIYEANRQLCNMYTHQPGHEAIPACNSIPTAAAELLSGWVYFAGALVLQRMNWCCSFAGKGNDIFTEAWILFPSHRGLLNPPSFIKQPWVYRPFLRNRCGTETSGFWKGYWKPTTLSMNNQRMPIATCSHLFRGDASVTEGEIEQAQGCRIAPLAGHLPGSSDNGWGISVTKEEARLYGASDL